MDKEPGNKRVLSKSQKEGKESGKKLTATWFSNVVLLAP